MITPEKTYSTNPFVDNIIYYAKLMGLNCTVKDEDEALQYETKETLRAADLLFACVEKSSKYDMFTYIPKEILSKYIESKSNLDLYSQDPKALKAYLNSINRVDKSKKLANLNSLARTVYIDHYDIMDNYLSNLPNTWLDDKRQLYQQCISGEATYLELFEELPIQTVLRILKRYLNYNDYNTFSMLWDESASISIDELLAIIPKPGETLYTSTQIIRDADQLSLKNIILNTNFIEDNIDYENLGGGEDRYDSSAESLNKLANSSPTVYSELGKISLAMREVFKDHYEMMEERKYFSTNVNSDPDIDGDEPKWMAYYHDQEAFEKCKNGSIMYYELYDLFPTGRLRECLVEILGEEDVESYDLMRDSEVLQQYFEDGYCDDPINKITALNRLMAEIYLNQYQLYMNTDIYYKCQDGRIDFYGLMEYLPPETIKSIIRTEFDEVTNIDIYSNNKSMLDDYLDSITEEVVIGTDENNNEIKVLKRDLIKDKINKDMQSWYPNNHIENNNYYRALMGLPPLDNSGKPFVDTLVHTYDDVTDYYTEFGNRFTSQCPTDIYPEYHWKQEMYKYDSYDVAMLEESGILDEYKAACGQDTNKLRYRYLNYLGDYALNIYECRKALNFQLIGMPTVTDTIIKRKFVDAFELNRDYIVRAVYSDAYKFQSDYFNKFIIIFIIINTMMDMLTGIPDLIINKDVFDARCIRYLFESYGIPYYAEIPIKYQQAMLKNFNTLIKYKSSTKNMVDICSLFGFKDVRVFGYYMMKDRATNKETGEFIVQENNEIDYDIDDLYVIDKTMGTITDISNRKFSKLSEYRNYNEEYYFKTISIKKENGSIEQKKIINNDRDLYIYDSEYNEMIPLKDSTYFTSIKANAEPSASLKFIKVPVDETLSNYKQDGDYIIDYDEITMGDDIWDGGLDHEYLKKKILDYEFNAVKSKYISIETTTDMTELAFQISYFYNMLFDGYYSEDGLTLDIPYLRSGHKFRLMDVICYMFALNYYYYGLQDTIMYSPTQILYVKGYNFNEDLNKILQDPQIFTQDPPIKNIFDINQQIIDNGYDYQKEFDYPHLKVKAFNLQADIDAINLWLNETYQMDLSDFIIEENDTDPNKTITLKSFFSLNNSYYQKSIFTSDAIMLPINYNNEIKYAYDYDIIPKVNINDINTQKHVYVQEKLESLKHANSIYEYVESLLSVLPKTIELPDIDYIVQQILNAGNAIDDYYVLNTILGYSEEEANNIINNEIGLYYWMEVIEDNNESVYIFDNNRYVILNGTAMAVYNRYRRTYGPAIYYRTSPNYYYKLGDEYKSVVNGQIRVKNLNGLYVFGANEVFMKNTETGEYTKVTDDKYFYTDKEDLVSILNLNTEYYILTPEGYKINTDLCYVRIVNQNGVMQYVPYNDIDQYAEFIVQDSGCYIRHSDGHFIRFDTTDYYIRLYGKNILKINRSLSIYKSDGLTFKYNPLSGTISISGSSTNSGYSTNLINSAENIEDLYYVNANSSDSLLIKINNYDKIKKSYIARFLYHEDTELTFCANASEYIDGIHYQITDGTNVYEDTGTGITFIAEADTLYLFTIEYDSGVNISDSIKASPQIEVGSTKSAFEPHRVNDTEYANLALYKEEPLFIKTNMQTEYFDPDHPDVFYRKLNDVYAENTYDIYMDELYIKDNNDNYILVDNILSPLNCYFINEDGDYELVIDNFIEIKEYDNPRNVRYALIKQPNNDYYKYKLDNESNDYKQVTSNIIQYIYDSNIENIIILHKDILYKDSNSLIVSLNRELNIDNIEVELYQHDGYKPSLTDERWDENDWYYDAPSSNENISIGMNGENIWYYRKPGSSDNPDSDNENTESDNIGSGYYIEASSYLGAVELEPGEEYYISFDVLTNFYGSLNIYCTADSNMDTPNDRLYYFRNNEKKHISQVFTANDITKPSLIFAKYNFNDNPIKPGDYVAVSNLRVIKSYSDNFITTDIPSYDQLDQLYRTNEKIYKWLINAMINTDDKVLYDIYKKLYDALMISNYNKEAFKLGPNEYAKTYTEFLKSRDEVLYNKLEEFANMEFEVMQKNIADEIIELTYALNEVLKDYNYLYAYFPGTSINFIQDYIYKIINWFKSWKVQLLGINTVYHLGGFAGSVFDNSDYLIKILQKNERKIKINNKLPDAFVYGNCKINPIYDYSPDGTPYDQLYDFDPVYDMHKNVGIKHRLRIIIRNGNSISYTDDRTNLRITVFDGSTHVWVNDTNILMVRTINGDIYEPFDTNQLLIKVKEDTDDADMWICQALGEINLLSGDYIEYSEMDMED